MATPDPNMKCVCGFRRFRESITLSDDTVQQWMLFDASTYGGLGSTPFGTLFGSGPSGSWGEFELDVTRTHKVLACESCGRVRSDLVVGGIGVFGSYLFGDSMFVLVSDSTLLSCLVVRYSNTALGISVDVSPQIYFGAALPLSGPAPTVVAPSPPPGAVLAGVLQARLPDVDHDGLFVVSLVDVCAGTELPLTNILLESAVQVHPASEAVLNVPASVAKQALRPSPPPAQAGSGTLGIPFDWCRTVIEYDARFGVLPGADGWSTSGSGIAALEPGGSLLMQSTGLFAFAKVITIPSAWAQAYMAASYYVAQSDSGTGDKGFMFRGDGAPGSSADYRGMRMRARKDVLATMQLGSVTAADVMADIPGGWVDFMAGMAPAVANGIVVLPETYKAVAHATAWGTAGGGTVSPTLRGLFGDFDGSNVVAHVRNFVVSEPGRFMRAFFSSYAAGPAQTLRLYFVSDIDGVGGQGARIRVRYGSGALGVNPYALSSASITDVTTIFNTRNVVVEVTVSLTGLTSQSPFWFSVERVWGHADDTTQATIHLLNGTVRSS